MQLCVGYGSLFCSMGDLHPTFKDFSLSLSSCSFLSADHFFSPGFSSPHPLRVVLLFSACLSHYHSHSLSLFLRYFLICSCKCVLLVFLSLFLIQFIISLYSVSLCLIVCLCLCSWDSGFIFLSS